jgi:hypothetical protein
VAWCVHLKGVAALYADVLAARLFLHQAQTNIKFMKTIICLVALCGMNAFGQTNQIIFPQLLSCSNTVLMTGAEYRCTTGTKVVFMKDDSYQSFEAAALNSNVLATIGVTLEKLEADKQRKTLNDASYQRERAADLARDAALQAEGIQHAQMEAKAEAQAQTKSTFKPQGTISISHTYISGGDALSGYEYGTATTTIPNN